MNHSLVTADRTTHLKIVVVALVAAIVVVAVGITARVTETDNFASRFDSNAPVLKAGKPATYSVKDGTAIR
jgi:hypothetical protein